MGMMIWDKVVLGVLEFMIGHLTVDTLFVFCCFWFSLKNAVLVENSSLLLDKPSTTPDDGDAKC